MILYALHVSRECVSVSQKKRVEWDITYDKLMLPEVSKLLYLFFFKPIENHSVLLNNNINKTYISGREFSSNLFVEFYSLLGQ